MSDKLLHKEWELIDALGTTYMTNFPLSEEELLAMPDVLRLRDVTSLVHRMGRFLAGLEIVLECKAE